MVLKQIGDSNNPPSELGKVENGSTIIADKTHLANLITTLKSELTMANSVLEIRESDCHHLNQQLEHKEKEHSDTKKRMVHIEKQCDNYRETVNSSLNLILLQVEFSCKCTLKLIVFVSRLSI